MYTFTLVHFETMRVYTTIFYLVLIFVVIFAKNEEGNGALCLCPRDYKPICASNGRTYPNVCVFSCEVKKSRSLGDGEETLKIVRKSPC